MAYLYTLEYAISTEILTILVYRRLPGRASGNHLEPRLDYLRCIASFAERIVNR